ncbi:uncharacterized protein M6B38_395415 [Iris pallida]|uniref:Uncharacterized protein n=1 Tax=Iris pallida TaxID=29817 RepID=A0AAX6DKR5_IRIPA|nr:uncharacterized protein M6B38_240025 [Iris pallida]KAJ6820793.1 uncharacterized protein M6B38_395415 [Iris pallida]
MENSKRSRNDDGVVEESVDSPEAKRLRADFLFDILDDEPRPEKDDGSGSDRDPAIDDLYSVMRSFEKEIATALPLDLVPAPNPDPNPNQPDLGFLLEASDDELGLPPPENAVPTGDGASDDVGFGKIWGFDDDFHLEFGFGSEERDNWSEVGPVIFDGGLFECAVPEFSDLTWRTEFLPAV